MATVTSQLILSVKIAAAAVAAVFLVGTPLAWLLARKHGRAMGLVEILVNLPLALPPTVVGYFLLLQLGRTGPIGKLTQWLAGSTLVFTPAAAVLASAIVALPLFVQGARQALEDIPPEVYEAAHVDGANRWQLFRAVSLPLAWHGFVSGLLLAFTRSLGEFGATMMVAGNIPGRTQTMALALYTAVQAGQDTTAKALALILTALAGISMGVGLRWRRKYRAP